LASISHQPAHLKPTRQTGFSARQSLFTDD
jgi:hypothetical protein